MHQLLSSELLNSQESVSQVCDRPCPFCQRGFERPIDLQQHIACHLESTALLSLPNLDDNDGSSEDRQVNSNTANRKYAESRAGDFDPTEPLLFLDDHSGDISVATEIDKELFELKLKAESVSFESMNESNAEVRQAYSSELARGWLFRLPHELDHGNRFYPPSPKPTFKMTTDAVEVNEERELDFPPENSSLQMNSDFGLSDFLAVGQLCWKVYNRCESSPGRFAKLSSDVAALLHTIKETEELLPQRHLTTMQRVKVITYREGCEGVLKDLNGILFKYERLGSNAQKTFDSMGSGMRDVHDIRARLISSVMMLQAFNNSYVRSAQHCPSYNLLNCCSYSQEAEDRATEDELEDSS